MTAELPPWRQGATPHQDIREDRVSEPLFAVNLSRAIAKEGAADYRDPLLFFQRTHLTRTLRSLVRDVLNTLAGRPGANSVIHLQTNFGGGKTHAELALYHLLTSPQAALAVPRFASLLAESGIDALPAAAVAALPCADLYAGGREVEGATVRTLWGEVAYRLGGLPLYELLRDSDQRLLSPGASTLREVLDKAGPHVILVDELLHYVDKAAAVPVGDSNLASQTLGFLRELTEAVDSVDHSLLVASLTMSRLEDLSVLSQEDAALTLAKLEDILRRVEDARTPVESSEIYDIVRARLFESVDDDLARQAAATYAQFYRSDPWRDLLPQESREAGYEDLLRRSYPFHPSIIKVLYERWGSRPQFQLTRGTLRFLAHLLAHLWTPDPKGFPKPFGSRALIHLSDVALSDDDVRGEALQVAGSAWEAIIGADIAAGQAEGASMAQRIDRERGGLYSRYGLVQGVASSVFMFTQGGQQSKPTPRAEVRLAVAQPAIPLSDLNQALDDCKARLYYYYDEEGGLLFKTEPNPNKVLADERVNVHTDDARRQVERVVAEVVGASDLFHVTFYCFSGGAAKEPGDVPDDGRLQLVVLPPRLTAVRGKIAGQTAKALDEVGEYYGKKHRLNRNMVLFLVPDSDFISGAIERAMDWIAANNVLGDRPLMERFSAPQQEVIQDKAASATGETKEYVRKAYNMVLLPAGPGQREPFDLSYVPPNKAVLEVATTELLDKLKLHRNFNPDLLTSRWASLWPKTATVLTTATLWEKFARQAESPILTGIEVLQDTIREGVEREIFGYGVLHDSEREKLKRDSYQHVYMGPFDVRDLDAVEIGNRTVLLRPEQVDALFPPIAKEEVAMVLRSLAGAKQTVEAVFWAARRSLTVQGRVDQRGFFAAVCDGVATGLFGYSDMADGRIVRGPAVTLDPDDVRFAGLLVGEDVPLPVTTAELAALVPADGRLPVQDLYVHALATYGSERVSEQGVINAVQAGLAEKRFGYAASDLATIQLGQQPVSLGGFVGRPEALPPNTRVLRFYGRVGAVDLANVIRTATLLGKLGDAELNLDLRLVLKGEVNDHSVHVALNELRGRVQELKIEDTQS
jgi:hypothetical protein